MLCELSEQEARHLERYRDLLPEFQEALDKEIKVLFELETRYEERQYKKTASDSA